MIDADVVAAMAPHTRLQAKESLKALALSGVIQLQLELELQRLLNGAESEEDTKVAQRVLEYRRRTAALTSLLSLGQTYLEESEN